MPPQGSRRKLLRSSGLLLTPVFAGCFGDGQDNVGPSKTPTEESSVILDPNELPGHVRPSHDPVKVPEPLVCDDTSFTRFDVSSRTNEFTWGTIQEGGKAKIALRTNNIDVNYGEEVTVSLTNLRSKEIETGHRDLYAIDIYTTEGWQEVRGWKQGTPRPYPDLKRSHEPKSGFKWGLKITEKELTENHIHEEALTVCPGLPAGRYRFVFHGTYPAVGVAFDVIR